MIAPPAWDQERLQKDLDRSKDLFRTQRIQEPLAAYLEAFDHYQGSVESLLGTSMDLAAVEDAAIDILTNPQLREAFRYLAGPPFSSDDLETLSEAVLTRKHLEHDPETVRRIVGIVQMGLDRRRFPWVAEQRGPTAHERAAAVLASAAMLATSRVGTLRRHRGKSDQEELVEKTLLTAGLKKIPARPIPTLNHAPAPGEFCRESILGPYKAGDPMQGRKADIIVGLWDNRVMPIECKVSNSAVNSVKRLNNDAAVKAETWVRDFGQIQVVPTAVLSGVYKLHNLVNAQKRGLTLFWTHNLKSLVQWIEETREAGPRKRVRIR